MSATARVPWRAAAPGLLGRLAAAGREHGALAALALLLLVNLLFTPNFASAETLWNVLVQVSPTLLVGVGMTLVLATGGVDLSVGSIMAVASAVAVLVIGHGAAAALLAGLAAAAVLGLVNGTLVSRYGVEPFLVTLAMQIAGRGLAQVISNNGQLVPFSDPVFEWLGQGFVGPVPVPVLIAAAVAGLAAFVVRATTFGRYLVAVGGNQAAARLAGVRVGRTKLLAYAASGVLSGLAGLIETARLAATDPSNLGGGIEFLAIAGAVIGGTSLYGGRARIGGTVAGVLILAVIGAAFNMLLVPFAWALLIQAGVILLAVASQRPRTV